MAARSCRLAPTRGTLAHADVHTRRALLLLRSYVQTVACVGLGELAAWQGGAFC
jgi:hypothetical protein